MSVDCTGTPSLKVKLSGEVVTGVKGQKASGAGGQRPKRATAAKAAKAAKVSSQLSLDSFLRG